jgi:hypothetical protein
MIKSRRMRWAGHVPLMGEKSEGNGQLVRSRRRWEDNIKMHLREIEWGGVDWIHLAQDRDEWRALVNTVMNLWVPYNIE